MSNYYLPFTSRSSQHTAPLSFHRIILLLLVLTIPALIASSKGGHAELTDANMSELTTLGKEIFNMKGCSGCHKIAGVGGSLGPDLTDQGNIVSHNAEWHMAHFKDPQSVVPGSMMPASDLSDPELEALTAFMLSLKSEELPGNIERVIKLAHEKLDEARKGIDSVKKSGFNVDDLEFKYVQGWTRLETINNMIYTHNLTGVSQETEGAISIARQIMQDVLSYKKELAHRVTQSIILIVLIVIIVVLVFFKLLTV